MPGPDPRPDVPAVGPDEHRRLQRALVALTDEDHARVEPPPEVWQGIRAALAGDEVVLGAASGPDPAAVVDLDERRARRSRRLLVGAVAATLALLVGVGAFLLGGDDGGGDGQLVAATELAPLAPGEGAVARVRLVEGDDHRRLELEAEGMPAAPAGHHYELWLLDLSSAGAEPVSLGPMTGTTTVDVPDDVDLDRYEVVDVSLQADGQVEHSGDSLLRGTLA